MNCCDNTNGIYLDKEGLMYLVQLIKMFVDQDVDRRIDNAVLGNTVIENKDILYFIKKQIEQMTGRSFVTSEEFDNGVTASSEELKQYTDNAIADTKMEITAEIQKAVADALKSAIGGGEVMTLAKADARYVNKNGDVMTGSLEAPSFVTSGEVEFL